MLLFGLFIFCSSFMAPEIKLDGVIDANEWKDAKRGELKGGGTLYYQQQGTVLYVAVKGIAKGWSHVYLAHNDTVSVMHASAALGAVNYLPQNGQWNTTEKFNWLLRDRVYNPATEQKLNDHFNQYGWAANNVNIGDGMSVEFKIDLSRFAGQRLAFAALFASDAANPHFFPGQLNDQSLARDLVYGSPPAQLEFKISNWQKL